MIKLPSFDLVAASTESSLNCRVGFFKESHLNTCAKREKTPFIPLAFSLTPKNDLRNRGMPINYSIGRMRVYPKRKSISMG
jgi:hypothetical protein